MLLAVLASMVFVLIVLYFRRRSISYDPDRELAENYTNRILSRYK